MHYISVSALKEKTNFKVHEENYQITGNTIWKCMSQKYFFPIKLYIMKYWRPRGAFNDCFLILRQNLSGFNKLSLNWINFSSSNIICTKANFSHYKRSNFIYSNKWGERVCQGVFCVQYHCSNFVLLLLGELERLPCHIIWYNKEVNVALYFYRIFFVFVLVLFSVVIIYRNSHHVLGLMFI